MDNLTLNQHFFIKNPMSVFINMTSRTFKFFSNKLTTFSLLCLMTLLTSCAHVAKHDGPPNYYVDETKVANAVPKPEPLAKYGNMRTYWVFGKPYHTLKTAKHYNVVGTASWYGTMFHQRRTSSGERYDMLGMTAAHKTLPLPTYVEVTNLKNNRKIIVKVNDRGPFASNRIIDLSYVAAKKLGMLGHGTAHVRVKAINPYTYGHEFMLAKNTHKKSLPAADQNQSFYIQVGAFRNKSHAEKLKGRLAALFDAPINIYDPSPQGKLYRVRIGPFTDVALANKVTHQLRHIGVRANKIYGM